MIYRKFVPKEVAFNANTRQSFPPVYEEARYTLPEKGSDRDVYF